MQDRFATLAMTIDLYTYCIFHMPPAGNRGRQDGITSSLMLQFLIQHQLYEPVAFRDKEAGGGSAFFAEGRSIHAAVRGPVPSGGGIDGEGHRASGVGPQAYRRRVVREHQDGIVAV